MGRLEFDFMTRIDFSEPVREHYFVLRCLPREDRGIVTESSEVAVGPRASLSTQHDSFGNVLTVGAIRGDHDRIEYRSHGVVRIGPVRDEACAEPHPLFRYPSPLTKPDGALEAFATDFAGPHATMGARTCADLSHAVHETMTYAPCTTSVRTTAAEAFAKRQGVCQDFAHILATLLRLLGVPARYVSGLAEGEGQTHAWVGAYADGRWHGLDPPRDRATDDGYLPLAYGRDWSDCPIENGSFRGYASQTQTVHFTLRRTA